ncbi:hypothetical protein SLS53_003563 [Cytospora paraplurivora]|uniref:Uncharacterized protein n=1 Tax=Cytospora paraplurivora TaxID=2898453 RepID=A0AAN9UI93_9PEZI
MKIMPKLFDSSASPAGNWRHLREFESGDSADRESWDMAVEYVHQFSPDWRVERDGVFVRRQSGHEEDMDFAEANGESHHPMMTPLVYGHNDADHLEAGVLGEGGDEQPGPIFFRGALRRFAFAGVARLPLSSVWLYLQSTHP